MAVTFNELLEGAGLSEEAQVSLQEAWESRLAEAREELTSELREEFAQRYEHDKQVIADAVDQFVTEAVRKEVEELAEDTKALSEERVKYRRAMTEHAAKLDKFVTEMLAKEVAELRADRAQVAEHINMLDDFIGEQLAEELKEFHEDKKALVEHKVKMVREGKRQLAETKKAFISEAAQKVETAVSAFVAKEVKSFRDDITAARENDFGRRIFEAFATEYNSSYLNETKEIGKYQKELSSMMRKLAEANEKIAAKDKAVQITESKLRAAKDRMARKEKLEELMRPLGKEKRDVMSNLLESVKTDKLDAAFNKYLPSVIGSENPRARKLTESVKKEHTGNKKAPARAEAKTTEDSANDIVTIEEIRKLAGI